MTPAPISVERFDPCLTPESDDMGLQSITADMELATFGEYVRHSDYAALLHQLAELEAKLAELRQACWDAREAKRLLLSVLYQRGTSQPLHDSIAAFLAASGGKVDG